MDTNNWMLFIVGICVMCIWPVNWYFRDRKRYRVFVFSTTRWHTIYAKSKDEAHIKAAKVAEYEHYHLTEY